MALVISLDSGEVNHVHVKSPERALCHMKGLCENMEAFSKTATNMPELMQSPNRAIA